MKGIPINCCCCCHYAKRDSRLSAYGGNTLQRVCTEKNVIRNFSLNFSKFCYKNNWSQCLVDFPIVILLFSAIRSLLSDLSLFEYPLARKSKKLHTCFWSDSCSKRIKRHWKHASHPNSSTELYGTGFSAPFQSNSKPNSSPQRTLQSSGFLVY